MQPSNNSVAKPFLRWAGSKRKQLARLSSFWRTDHRRYIEPFAGSACLFFKIAPQKAILGDNNRELIEVYRTVRNKPELLHAKLCQIPRDSVTYYHWRQMLPSNLDSETRALRFLYLNRNCFNGIFRTNNSGHFNVPIGSKLGAYFTKEDLVCCASLLRCASLVAADFTKTLELVEARDFVYLDPPFAVQSRRVFREYNQNSFKLSDIPRLAQSLAKIHKIGANFLVSYADCAESRCLAKEWNSIRLPTRRHIAGFASQRKTAYECLITNMAIPDLK